MPSLSVAIPLVGILLAAGLPLLRHTITERRERTAIDLLAAVNAAQQQFNGRFGGYSPNLESLTQPCSSSDERLLADRTPDSLTAIGYSLVVRPAHRAHVTGRDCHGREVVSDYYIAAAPVSAATWARQAFASRSDARIFLFYDGIPPRETEIDSGLPTPVDARESFKIP